MIDEIKEGEQVVLDQTISPISGRDGDRKKFVVVAQDITTRKEQKARRERPME